MLHIEGKEYLKDEWTNITPRIMDFMKSRFHQQKYHPICIIKRAIVDHFYSSYRHGRGPIFTVIDDISPVVTTEQNFDSMLIPKDHVSRRKQDNYYINEHTMLRAHTSAHEVELMKYGFDAFLTVGDVYRRDTIDATHYPVFHQLEGVRLFAAHELTTVEDSEEVELFESAKGVVGVESELKQACHTLEASKLTEYDLKYTLERVVKHLFGEGVEFRWVDAYFPFTHPSFEMEIKIEDDWVEMLGCGVLRQEIADKAGAKQKMGWAFGLGLERLAMKLFRIPDIRYFWSQDRSFVNQFEGIDEKNFRRFRFKNMLSKQPAVVNDISFWLPDREDFDSNDFHELVRNLGGDLVENVQLFDVFENPKNGLTSHSYRVYYRHLSRPLQKDEISKIDSAIKKELIEQFSVTPRWVR